MNSNQPFRTGLEDGKGATHDGGLIGTVSLSSDTTVGLTAYLMP